MWGSVLNWPLHFIFLRLTHYDGVGEGRTVNHFSGYADLPKLTGWGYLITAFVGRMPTAMTVIGVLTLVTSVTGSVGQAGFASAALAIATGIANPTIGRLTDTYGQRLPLAIIAPINIAALLAMVLTIDSATPLWLTMALSALIGATTIPLGALARVRWYPLATKPYQISSALSWESVADEMSFVLGPAAVGILASQLSPKAPLIIAAIIVASCVIPFAFSRFSVGPAVHRDGDSAPSIARVLRCVVTPLAAMGALGMFFGSMQTSVTAFAQASGNEGNAGIIYATMGLGAAITALASVALPASLTMARRIIAGGISVAFGALACIVAPNDVVLAAAVFATGLGIGPASVAIFTLAGERAPRGGDAVAVTALGSVNVLGVAVCSSITGQVVERSVSGGFAIAASCALLMAVGAWVSNTYFPVRKDGPVA